MSFQSSPWFLGAIKKVLERLIPELDKRYHLSTKVIPKENTGESITVDADGTMHVGGRLGQFPGGGIYSPVDISPTNVGAGSVLVTDGSGTFLGTKSLSVSNGAMYTVTLAANAKTFTMTDTYQNRILAATATSATVAIDEATAKTNYTTITSITQGGATFDISKAQSGTIVFNMAKSLGNTSALTKVRIYPKQDGFSNLLGGVAGSANGYSIIAGQQVYNGGNASAVFGNSQYNKGNSSILGGRQHINTKQNAALFGYGHDTSNGTTEVFAAGKFADIKSTTAFAIGMGTSATARKNSFEIDTTGNLYLWGTNTSGNAAKFKIAVVNGSLTATQV